MWLYSRVSIHVKRKNKMIIIWIGATKRTKRAEEREEETKKDINIIHYYELTMDIIARALSKLFYGDTLARGQKGEG